MFINRAPDFSCIHAEMKKLKLVFLFLTLASIPAVATSSPWEAVKGQLMTPWAKDVSPDNVWPEYPRPQMVRETWKNLNGLWDYAIRPRDGAIPKKFDGQILVPFCVESSLSGVRKELRPEQHLWYRRLVEIPKEWRGQRVSLHFGAVDWHATVWVNGQKVGEHKGGYDPFTFDITGSVKANGKQEIIVGVTDSTNTSMQAVGKQTLPDMRTGWKYTPTSGIWQTVWLEPVPVVSIERLKIIPDIDQQQVTVEATLRGKYGDCNVELQAYDGDKPVASAVAKAGTPIVLKMKKPKLWSPDSPFLYTLKVSLLRNEETLDYVDSYFGMRKIAVGKDKQGINRILLNNEQIFQYGPLDQAYWPDGILIPATDEALRFDLEYLKKIACNMVRKHMTVAPDRWYYHCDRLGLLVWQDMVSPRKFGGRNIHTPETATQWELEQKRMIDYLYNHPSIVVWTVFNEGWGQYDTERLTKWTMDYDPTRLVNNASGGIDFPVGNMRDLHDYSFHPSLPLPGYEKDRAIVLGEAGGFNLILPGHVWHTTKEIQHRIDPVMEIGRETYANADQFAERYEQWIQGLRLLTGNHGLCAVVYTQLTDLEHEPNGWLTYDRVIRKIDTNLLKKWHESLYQAQSVPKTILATSIESPQRWKFTMDELVGEWTVTDFDDSHWNTGNGPFGNTSSGLAVGTRWDTQDIYLRKAINLDEIPNQIAIRIYGLGTCDVYLNGKLVKRASSRDRVGQIRVCDVPLFQRGNDILRKGENVIAVHCSMASPQIRRRPLPSARFIDVGLVEPID